MQLDVALKHPTSCCDVSLPEDSPGKTRGCGGRPRIPNFFGVPASPSKSCRMRCCAEGRHIRCSCEPESRQLPSGRPRKATETSGLSVDGCCL